MTVATPGGTREVGVPRMLREIGTLAEEQLQELGAVVRRLERALGWPVDVECAFARGRLYLLQCRPITALERAA
jgi:pyruvate,water dikinase